MKHSKENNTATITIEEVLEQLPGHIYWKSKDGMLLGCNKKNWQDLGLSSLEDYIKKTDYDLFPKDQADELAKIDREVIHKKETVVVEAEAINIHDNSTALYLTNKAPLKDQEGNIIGISGVSLDVTAAHKKELKNLHLLENIISLIPGHVYWKDTEGKYLGSNNEQAKTLGLKSGKEIINKKPYENLPKKERQLLTQSDDKVIKSGETITLEEPGIRENGSPGIFLTKKTPLYNQYGTIIGLIGVSFDITKRKKAEIMLKKAKEEAEKSNKIKSSFISNMEHDIRTPFVGIYGTVDTLAKQESNPNKKAILCEVASCAKELMDYCNGILDFSKIESDSLPLLSKSFILPKLFDSVIIIESIIAKHKKLDLSLNYDESLPKVVIGDPYRLKRILINLISNAIKFTETGFVKVSAILNKKDEKKREAIIKIVIEDSGIGIPEDKKELVYGQFTRIMPSNTGLYKGIGLGLCIVKQFINELNGDIHLSSKVGKGSKFTIFLPLKIPLSQDIIDSSD